MYSCCHEVTAFSVGQAFAQLCEGAGLALDRDDLCVFALQAYACELVLPR